MTEWHRSPKQKQYKYVVKPGFTWNPLVGYPRNKDCFCGSLLKFKICCMKIVADVVTIEQEHQIKLALKKGSRIIVRDHETEEHANQVETEDGK